VDVSGLKYPCSSVPACQFAAKAWSTADAAYNPVFHESPELMAVSLTHDPPLATYVPSACLPASLVCVSVCLSVCVSVCLCVYQPVSYFNSSRLRRLRASGLPFNALDHSGDVSVERRSAVGTYEVVDSMPRFDPRSPHLLLNEPSNPTGRTGFAGRGLLPRWGPNHCVDPIITRYDGNRATT
jgi:hypothetical protein